ncbi:MAG: DUF262 domain-containing protein [Acidimicrobiia bacterium]|nr:MAG: DUF262 domain-containing protein [Acidimicrobiia bacterium]
MDDYQLALPDFQRDFVWDPADVQSLIASIMMGYPCGALLFLQQSGARGIFRERWFQGVPPGKPQSPPKLVLDGQQRLTALYQALRGVGDTIYYLDLKALKDSPTSDDVEKSVLARSRRGRSPRTRAVTKVDDQARQELLPVAKIVDGLDDWLEAVDGHRNKRGDPAARKAFREFVKSWVDPVKHYQFPVVSLPEKTSLDAVCKIFETLNLRGVSLTVFELLTARFWPDGVDLRAHWDNAQAEYPLLKEFGVDPYSLLQAVSVRTTRARVPAGEKPSASAQRSDVLKLTATDFTAYWESVTKGADAAVRMLRDECGVLDKAWMPYATMLVPLSAIWHKISAGKGPERGRLVGLVERYFWCTVFMRNYDQGGNSQAGRDYVDLESWFEGGTPPEAVAGFTFDMEILKSARTNLKALYRGIVAMTLNNKCRDFHKGMPVTPDSMRELQVESHHIFPQAWLAKHKKGAESDLIVNRAMIDNETNKRIGARPPSEYLSEIRDVLQGMKCDVEAVLQSHVLPPMSSDVYSADAYDEFVLARAALLHRMIKELATGRARQAATTRTK